LLASPALAQDAASSGCLSSGTGLDQQAPCFHDNDNILGGSHELFPNEDLMLVGWRGATSYVNLPLYTDDPKPTLENEQTVTTTDCAPQSLDPLPFSTQLGRVYAIDHDVIVSSTWAFNPIGCTQQFYVIDRDPETQADTVLHTIGWSDDVNGPRLALFDADRDGFDDIFTINAEGMQFHSPDDVLDLTSKMAFRSSHAFGSDNFTPRGDPVTGDFNGDGAIDIA